MCPCAFHHRPVVVDPPPPEKLYIRRCGCMSHRRRVHGRDMRRTPLICSLARGGNSSQVHQGEHRLPSVPHATRSRLARADALRLRVAPLPSKAHRHWWSHSLSSVHAWWSELGVDERRGSWVFGSIGRCNVLPATTLPTTTLPTLATGLRLPPRQMPHGAPPAMLLRDVQKNIAAPSVQLVAMGP